MRPINIHILDTSGDQYPIKNCQTPIRLISTSEVTFTKCLFLYVNRVRLDGRFPVSSMSIRARFEPELIAFIFSFLDVLGTPSLVLRFVKLDILRIYWLTLAFSFNRSVAWLCLIQRHMVAPVNYLTLVELCFLSLIKLKFVMGDFKILLSSRPDATQWYGHSFCEE